MLGFLRKDYNRHSSYNVGVTFYRIGSVFLLFTLALLVVSILYMPQELVPEGDHDFTIVKAEKHSIKSQRIHTVYYTRKARMRQAIPITRPLPRPSVRYTRRVRPIPALCMPPPAAGTS